MCTVALTSHRPGHLLMVNNRDEQRTRLAAEPPQRHALPSGVIAAYPRDADAGGTWIGANSCGLAITLLNHYDASAQREAPREVMSRGVVIPALLAARTLDEVLAMIAAWEVSTLKRLRPFWLIVAHAPRFGAARAWRLCWDGETLTQEALTLPCALTTSSVRAQEVVSARARALEPLLERAAWRVEEAAAIFSAHAPERGARSICMHREDAQTVSHTTLVVDDDQLTMTYQAGSPCEGGQTQRLVVARTT